MDQGLSILIVQHHHRGFDALIEAIHQTGYPIDTIQITAADHLNKQLDHQDWDLFLVFQDTSNHFEHTTQLLKQHSTRVPIIGLFPSYNGEDFSKALDLGISDCIVESSLTHLTATIKKEIERTTTTLAQATKENEPIKASSTPVENTSANASSAHDAFEGTLANSLQNIGKTNLISSLLVIYLDEVAKQRLSDTNLKSIEKTAYKFFQSFLNKDDSIDHIDKGTYSLLIHAKTREETETLAELIRQSMTQQPVGNTAFTSTVSIACSALDNPHLSAQQLLQRTLTECRKIHAKGGNQVVHTFEKNTLASLHQRQTLIKQTEQALRSGTCYLVYQPIVSLHAEPVEYYESLLRIHNQAGCALPIGEIFALEEQPELLMEIDKRVLKKSMEMLSEHYQRGEEKQLFIILSTGTLLNKQTPGMIQSLLKKYNIPGHLVTFEIKEIDASINKTKIINFIDEVSLLGANCSLTHFGRNKYSMQLLDELDVKFIKLDGYYTRLVSEHPEGELTLKELVDSLHKKAKLVVVPLVEQASSLTKLWRCGVNYIQGYYLQAPDTYLGYDFSGQNVSDTYYDWPEDNKDAGQG